MVYKGRAVSCSVNSTCRHFVLPSLTTRFARSVVLDAMGAMLPPMPPSVGMRIVSHHHHRESIGLSLSSSLGHERSSSIHGHPERLQTLLQLKISKSPGRTEQLSQKIRNFAGRNNRNNFWCSLIYQNLDCVATPHLVRC